MAKHYVTFGQDHLHRINGVTFDADCVAVFDAPNHEQGRAKAFELFGPKFCFEYHGAQFDNKNMKFFPRGLVQVPYE
jgi:hypothetical protein